MNMNFHFTAKAVAVVTHEEVMGVIMLPKTSMGYTLTLDTLSGVLESVMGKMILPIEVDGVLVDEVIADLYMLQGTFVLSFDAMGDNDEPESYEVTIMPAPLFRGKA